MSEAQHNNNLNQHRISDASSSSANSAAASYSLNAGRDAFKNTPLLTDNNIFLLSQNDTEELRRQQFAIRSFTQSIEMDLPPAPELPPTLDIDHYGFTSTGGLDTSNDISNLESGMTPSSTADTIDTIVEVKTNGNGNGEDNIDPTMGETQKYPMTVPAPGHTEQEMELHKSLVKHENEGDEEDVGEENESDTEIKNINNGISNQTSATSSSSANINNNSRRTSSHHEKEQHHDPLRREYSNAAKQRPRPTTPTQKCTLESYISVEEKNAPISNPIEKIKVVIPRKSLKGRQPEDFYQSMSNQLPPQIMRHRSNSNSNYSDYGNDDDDLDIIEQNPEYKDKAPKAPVVHRRTSIEWEAFDQSVDRTPMADNNAKATEASTTTSTPPTTPSDTKEAAATTSPTDERAFVEEFKEVVADKIEKVIQTAEAFAEELFGKNDDDWATTTTAETTTTSGMAQHQPSADDPFFGVDQSEEPGIAEVPEVHLTEYENTHEHHEHHEHAKAEDETPVGDVAGEGQNSEEAKTEEQQQPTGDETTAAAATDQQYYDYNAAYGYDQNYANYDPNQAGHDPNAAAYDPAAAYNYDQSAYNYDQTTAGAYDYSQYGYDQTTGAAYSQADYPGYDATSNAYAGYDQNDPNYATAAAPTTDYSSYSQQSGDVAQTADYDYSAYGQTAAAAAAAYNPFATAGTDSSITAEGYDYGTTDPSAAAATSAYADPATAATDYSYNQGSYYDTTQYGGEYQYGDNTAATDYSQYGYPAETHTADTSTATTETTPAYSAPESQTFSQQQPILPPMRPQAHDPYSWDSHEHQHHTAPVAPTRPAPPPISASGEKIQSPSAQESSQNVHKAPPPPRPTPPTPETTHKPSRPPPPSPQPARPPPPVAKVAPPPPTTSNKRNESEEEEEDPWARFNKMSEKVSSVVKTSEEKIKEISGKSAANEIKDESYLSNIGGSQGMMSPAVMRQMQQLEEEKKKAKADKKRAKHLKRPQSPEVTQKQEEDMDRAAQELAARIVAKRAHDLDGWQPPGAALQPQPPPPPPPPTAALEAAAAAAAMSSPESGKSKDEEEESLKNEEKEEEPQKMEIPSNWAGFGESGDFSNANLPTSDSDFFTLHLKEVPPAPTEDPFAPPKSLDPFAPSNGGDDFDPFDIRPAEDIVAQAKERANLIAQREDDQDIDYLHPSSTGSSPTPEGGSPVSSRPVGFEDEFKPPGEDLPTPLYDEDDSEPLTEFPKKFTGEGWDLMIRYPPKKKIMADRYWKPCFVRIKGNMLYIFNSKTDDRPMQEIMLQPTYSLSDATLQAYDVYGKIHTVKLQYVQYKERIGIRSGQIARLVEGHITKYGMPIEHAAQVTILSKFGCLNSDDLATFINAIEDFLFISKIAREVVPQYKQDEVQIHCYDEYQAYVDKDGFVSQQQARVRMFCLAFISGSPFLEIGLNDRRRQGKEIVRRKDILPMYTERWIRFENLDFHCTVDKKAFEEEQLLKLSPPDGVFIEICRFRVRPPKNREKPLIVKSIMKIAGSKIEIRIDAMVAAHTQRAKGTNESLRTIPCEDIVIRFPIPEAWIYIFREERHWGVGSVHSKTRRPGKVKNLKDRIMGAVQQTENTLIEVAIGEAKYEHVYRSLVWRIPRLPEKHHAAYKVHLLKCRFDLSSFDLMPESFLPTCDVEFTMPLATISNTVVRSVSVEQHEDSDRVEKFVRYVAKCKYQLEVDYVQCNDLDNDAIFDAHVIDPEAVMSKQPDQHKPLFNPEEVDKQHGGYGIEFNEFEMGNQNRKRNDSSSDDEPEKRPVPIIEINMKGYGY